MSRLQVGVASVDFTPEPGLPLMGNFRSDYAARGVHDPLRARALVLAGKPSERAAVLALDICMLDRQNVAFLREAIAAECDLPPENVLIHATHTHSAPAPSGMLGMEAEVAPYAAAIERFLRKAATAVVQASRRMEEAAALEIGSVTAPRVSFNRRLRRRDGATQMNWESLQPGFDPAEILSPWGPVDEELVCLAARFERRTAALVNFGLHPAILAGDNWLYSADYPGYLTEAVALSRQRLDLPVPQRMLWRRESRRLPRPIPGPRLRDGRAASARSSPTRRRGHSPRPRRSRPAPCASHGNGWCWSRLKIDPAARAGAKLFSNRPKAASARPGRRPARRLLRAAPAGDGASRTSRTRWKSW